PIDLSVCTRAARGVVPVAGAEERKSDDPSVFVGSNCQIPVFIRSCNSGVTCGVTSTHITIILEVLLKHGDDTLGDSSS
ncbi:hypothetical protein TNCV_2557151, partial [Trichonephila clavipes]